MNSLETIVLSVLQGKDWHWKPARLEVLVSIKSKLPSRHWICYQIPTSRGQMAEDHLEILHFLHSMFDDALTTKDRLLQWVYNGYTACAYHSSLESRNHLYFECAFTKRLWKEAMRCCLISRLETGWEKFVK